MNEGEDGEVIIGYKGRIVRIIVSSKLDVCLEESNDKFIASGVTDIAIGVMEFGLKKRVKIKELIKEAIIITSKHNAFVNNKCKVIEMSYK